MKCASCGTENPDGARFCAGCGGKLAAEPPACPACAAPLLPGALFCHACGAAVAPSASPTQNKPSSDPKADPALAATLDRTASNNWRPGWTFEAIPSQPAAVAMCRIGVFACGLLAIVAGLASFAMPEELRLFSWFAVAVYAVSGYGLWRHQAWAGLLALAFYGLNVISGLVMGMAAKILDQGVQGFFMVLLLYVILPLALISGLRGALAWRRFERAKASAPNAPA